MGNAPGTLDQIDQLAVRLESRLTALEQRVSVLEHHRADSAASTLQAGQSATHAAPALRTAEPDTGSSLSGVFPVLGAALLGIAGAYVLRAVSGANLLPRGVVAAVAALYATGWLFASARIHKRAAAAAVYAATALLILAPMLWEMTVRFRAMSGSSAVAILAGFAVIALLLEYRSDSGGIGFTWIGVAFTALVLSLGTHRVAEFTALIVILYAVAHMRRSAPLVRPSTAIAADLAVWTLLYLYRLPAAERTDYPALPAMAALAFSFALFAITAASLAHRSLLRHASASAFDALQAMASFVLLLCGFRWLLPGEASFAIGVVCLLLTVLCAAAAYGPFRRAVERRNYHLFSLWAVALLIVSAYLLLPAPTASAVLAISGAALLVVAQTGQITALEAQSLLLLLTGAFGSGTMFFVFDVLAGAVPPAPGLRTIAVLAAIAACCVLLRDLPGTPARSQVVPFVPALLFAFGLVALATRALVGAAAAFTPVDPFLLATIRTVMLCLLAVGLATAGARLARPQLLRVAWLALAFVTAKLLFEDLRHGQMGYIAASIFVVALTMLAVPRLARSAKLSSR